MTREPDLRELVGEDLEPDEERRLRRVHELLLAAGPPPELTPELEQAPVPGAAPAARVLGLPTRRRGRVLTAALGFAAAMLVVGYLFGARSGGFDTDFTVHMSATPAAPGASALIDVAPVDSSGNWPLRMKVRGLPEQPQGQFYELFLTEHGRAVASCGTFRVHGGTTEVRLNAPYRFDRFDGWVVTAHRPGKGRSAPLLEVERA